MGSNEVIICDIYLPMFICIYLPSGMKQSDEGAPVAQVRIGHRALKIHENKGQPALIYCI